MTKETLSNLLRESRRFDPPPELAAHANVTADAYKEAAADRLAFWADKARRLDWEQPWDQVLDWSHAPFAKWFTGGTINASVNCVDRHVAAWSRFEGMYFAGDGAKKDADGDLWLLGRVDDIMLVSGHNISTTEVESALVSHPRVAEAAVVGASDPVTGQGIVAFTILRGDGGQDDDDLATELRNHVVQVLGPICRPRQILVVAELPKTRLGKIMRRLLRDVAEHRSLGDVTTLTDSTVMDLISEQLPTAKADD